MYKSHLDKSLRSHALQQHIKLVRVVNLSIFW